MTPCHRARFVSVAALLAGLIGCGGGGIESWIAPIDADDAFNCNSGSIALNLQTFAGAITAGQPSRETSDEKALEVCGGGCTIVLRHAGKRVCAAIARAPNRQYGNTASEPAHREAMR